MRLLAMALIGATTLTACAAPATRYLRACSATVWMSRARIASAAACRTTCHSASCNNSGAQRPPIAEAIAIQRS